MTDKSQMDTSNPSNLVMEIDIFGTKHDEEIMLQEITPITTKNPLDRCPAAVYLATLSPDARRTMGFALKEISQLLSSTVGLFFPWWEIRYQHTQAIRQYMIEHYKPATVNRKLAALRGVLKQAWLLGFMSAEDISIVAKMAGHSSTQTTARYDRRGEVAKRKAAGKLHVPYMGRK